MNKQLTRQQQRYEHNELVDCIIDSIDDKKGLEIISLDLRKITDAAADYFIICNGESTTQVRAIADHVGQNVKEKIGEAPWNKDISSLEWVILDYSNVVVHVFMPEKRTLYNLEELWGDAVFTHHTEGLPH